MSFARIENVIVAFKFRGGFWGNDTGTNYITTTDTTVSDGPRLESQDPGLPRAARGGLIGSRHPRGERGGRRTDERGRKDDGPLWEMCIVRCNTVTGDAQSPQSALPSAFTATLNFFRRLLIYRRLSSRARQTGKNTCRGFSPPPPPSLSPPVLFRWRSRAISFRSVRAPSAVQIGMLIKVSILTSWY